MRWDHRDRHWIWTAWRRTKKLLFGLASRTKIRKVVVHADYRPTGPFVAEEADARQAGPPAVSAHVGQVWVFGGGSSLSFPPLSSNCEAALWRGLCGARRLCQRPCQTTAGSVCGGPPFWIRDHPLKRNRNCSELVGGSSFKGFEFELLGIDCTKSLLRRHTYIHYRQFAFRGTLKTKVTYESQYMLLYRIADPYFPFVKGRCHF